mgnify:CR=1 FL=1
MKATKIIGILMLLAGLYTSYLGVQKINDNSTEIKALGIELDISNENEKQEGYIYLGLGVLLIFSGTYLTGKK